MEQEARRILIVKDDRRLAELIRECLESSGLRVDIGANGALAAARILAERPDLIVLDLTLSDENGLSICRQMCPQFDGPVLMLTARTSDIDEVLGLGMDADDCVYKPVRLCVLLARVRALLRRSETSEAGTPVADSKRLAFGRLMIDSVMREAWLGGITIELTSAEFDPFWLLMANAGCILSREEIFSALHGIEYDGQNRSTDACVSQTHPKTGDDPVHPWLIKTVRSKGYLFVGGDWGAFFLRARAWASRSARINNSE